MSANNANNITLTLQDFYKISTESMDISVTKFNTNLFRKTTYEVILIMDWEDGALECKVEKRYTEFQGFYDSLTYRYKNLKFPDFPSKFQLVKQNESRKKFFDSLLKTVLKLAEAHPEIKKELLKLLYEFVINSGVEIKKILETRIKDRKSSFNESMHLASLFGHQHSGSIDRSILEKKSIDDTPPKGQFLDKRNPREMNDTAMIATMFHKEDVNSKDCWQVEFKFLKNKFSKAYLKISEQCLFLYDSIIANNYFFCLPLFKVQFEIFKLSENKKVYIEGEEIIETANFLTDSNVKELCLSQLKSDLHFHLFHNYDNSTLIIKLDHKNNTFASLVDFYLTLESHSNLTKSQSKFIQPTDETNLNIYGKLSLEVVEIKIPQFEGNIFANIILNPYSLKTKSVINKEVFSIKQTFSLPIHNRFELLKIEIYSQTHQGLFQKKIVDEKICEHFIYMPDVLNNYFPDKIYNLEMDGSLKNTKSSYKVSLSFKLTNFSSLLSLVTKNRNKNVLEDMTLAKSVEDISMKNLMKRLKKIIILLKDFKEYYKTLFRFKYPVYSSLMCLILLVYFILCDMNYVLTHILVFISYIMFVHSNSFKSKFYPFVEKYIFTIRNPYDFDSIVVTKVELEVDEVKKDNYLTHQETKKNIIKAIIEPIKNFKTYKNTYNQVLFKFTSFVAMLEKIKNLFLWTDPLLSFYFSLIIVALFTLVYSINIRYLMVIAVLNKFINGVRFFKRKYINNIEIAEIVLRFCHLEHFNETKNKLKLIQTENLNISQTIGENKGIDNIAIYDDKFKLFIKEQLEKHTDVLIKMEFLNSVNKLGEIKDAISKSKTMLKIKKESQLYKFTRNNPKIYKTPIDIELIFMYFVQNIKSDYYVSKYSHHEQEGNSNGTNNYTSISHNDVVNKPPNNTNNTNNTIELPPK